MIPILSQIASPETILTSVCIGISGWALTKIMAIDRKVERIEQRIDDLPCKEKKCK